MMAYLLAQSSGGGLTPNQRAIRDHMASGDSIYSVLMVVGVLVLIVVVAYVLTQRLEKYDGTSRRNDPQKLFHDLLNRLNVTDEQRKILERISYDLRITNPAVLLMCPALFDKYCTQWKELSPSKRPTKKMKLEHELLAARTILFPATA